MSGVIPRLFGCVQVKDQSDQTFSDSCKERDHQELVERRDLWIQSLENITVTEKLTYKVKLKGDCFKKDWDRWLEYNAKEARRLKKKGQDSRTDNIMLDIRKVAAEYLYMCARTSQPPRVWGPSSPHRLVVLGVGGWALRYVLAHSRWLLGLAPLARSGPFWVVEGPQVSGPGGSVRSGIASCHSPL